MCVNMCQICQCVIKCCSSPALPSSSRALSLSPQHLRRDVKAYFRMDSPHWPACPQVFSSFGQTPSCLAGEKSVLFDQLVILESDRVSPKSVCFLQKKKNLSFRQAVTGRAF